MNSASDFRRAGGLARRGRTERAWTLVHIRLLVASFSAF